MSAFVLFLANAIAFSEYYFSFKGMREQRKKDSVIVLASWVGMASLA